MVSAPAACDWLQVVAGVSEFNNSHGGGGGCCSIYSQHYLSAAGVRQGDRLGSCFAPPGTLLLKATTVLPEFRPTFNSPLNQKT